MDNVMNILKVLFAVLVFPGFLFTSSVGLLLAGIDRKLVARMQKRVGPPLLQPLYDFFKLMGKETIVPQAANKKVFLVAPIIGAVSLSIMMLFIPMFGGKLGMTNGTADMIVIIYLLTIPAVALIIGGSASASPFAGIGISREMVTMMAYELPLILVFLAVAKLVGGNTLCFSLGAISDYQMANGSLITNWQLIPAAIAFLLIIPAEVGTQPFDVAEAETEICEGPLIEFSGAPLAIFKLNASLKMFIMTSLFSFLFLGGIFTGAGITSAVLLWVIRALLALAFSALLTFLTMTLPHAVMARLKIEHLFKFYWTFVAALAFLSLLLVWLTV